MSSTLTHNQQKAIQIVDGMVAMLHAHRLRRGLYVFDPGNLPPLENAPMCNGYQACAMGALWLSCGVKPVKQREDGHVSMRGAISQNTFERNRDIYNTPLLGAVLLALNASAQEFLDQHHDTFSGGGFEDPIEQFFEGEWLASGAVASDADVHEVLDRARDILSDVDVDEITPDRVIAGATIVWGGRRYVLNLG